MWLLAYDLFTLFTFFYSNLSNYFFYLIISIYSFYSSYLLSFFYLHATFSITNPIKRVLLIKFYQLSPINQVPSIKFYQSSPINWITLNCSIFINVPYNNRAFMILGMSSNSSSSTSKFISPYLMIFILCKIFHY